jgi:hypothetical protein
MKNPTEETPLDLEPTQITQLDIYDIISDCGFWRWLGGCATGFITMGAIGLGGWGWGIGVCIVIVSASTTFSVLHQAGTIKEFLKRKYLSAIKERF